MNASADMNCILDGSLAGGVLRIDLSAVRHNYGTLARAAAPARCGAVVKADAYGLGAAAVAPVLYGSGCRDFFVAHAAEGLALRPRLAPDATIFVLNGIQPGGEPACAGGGLTPVLNSPEQAHRWAAEAAGRGLRLPAALQLDSGMSRLGMMPADLDGFLAREDLPRRLDLRLVMSHLACADEPDHPANAAQRRSFAALAERFPGARLSLANSGGILLGPGFTHDLARPGLALYGVSPTPGRDIGLRPMITLQARVIQVRAIPAGTAVGYGATFVAPAPMRVATVAVGYADGWPRHLSGVGGAYHGSTRLPILGRVSMDSMTVDATALPDGTLTLGSLVELIGPHQSLDAVAAEAGTIAYEILTRLGRRYARYYDAEPGADPYPREVPGVLTSANARP